MAILGFVITRTFSAGQGSDALMALAGSALAKGDFVRVFLCFDGVYQAISNQRSVEGQSSQSAWIDALRFAGADVTASHACMEARGLHIDELHPGVRTCIMEELSELIGISDKVVCL